MGLRLRRHVSPRRRWRLMTTRPQLPAHETRPDRLPALSPGRTFAVNSGSPSLSDSDNGWVRGRSRVRSRSKSARGGRGPPAGIDDVDARGYSAGGDDSDEIVLLGESTTRSQSPYDLAIHTMEEVDVPKPALGSGVGVGAWGLPADGEGMDLDSVTDMAGAGDGARSGVGGLGSGQVSLREAGGQDEAMAFASDLGDPDADARRPSTSLQASAGQHSSADELRRQQAKNQMRQNVRRKWGLTCCAYAPPTAISRRNTHWENSLSMIQVAHVHPTPFQPLISLIHAAILPAVE